MKFYVYSLLDPETNLPFYIGKGKNTRYKSHLRERLETTSNKRKFFKIQSIRNKGFEPIVQFIHTNLSEQEAFRLEALEIAKFGRKDFDPNGILFNLTLGGEGSSGHTHKKTQEQKDKLKAARQRQAPHSFTAEEKHKISLSNKIAHANKTLAEKKDTADKISKALTGKPKPECLTETRLKRSLNMLGKKKCPITKTWISLEEFNRITQNLRLEPN